MSDPLPPNEIDAKSFWQTLGQRPIGVSIVTAQGADGPAGFLALSAAHITANPPSMLVSVDDRTAALAAILHARHFAVNYLPAGTEALADLFGGKGDVKGTQRFDAADWQVLATGAPILKNAVGAFDCVLEHTHRYSNTTIAIGRVSALLKSDGDALIFRGGRYSTFPAH